MQVQLTESRDSVMTVHAAERTIPSKQTAAERAPRNERVGRVSTISLAEGVTRPFIVGELRAGSTGQAGR